jgi:endonuclease YncB( thermonuclease family)
MSDSRWHGPARRGRPPPPEGRDVTSRLLRLLRPSNLRAIAVLVILGLAYIGLLPPETIRGTAEVIDGDSLIVGGARLRLYGIDAPELDQPCLDGAPCGARARDHLAKVVAWRSLLCDKRDVDRYGRDVVQCFLARQDSDGKQSKGADIARTMVRDGQAMAYRGITTLYADAEPARFDFEPPWDWRAKHEREEQPPGREAGPRVRRTGDR